MHLEEAIVNEVCETSKPLSVCLKRLGESPEADLKRVPELIDRLSRVSHDTPEDELRDLFQATEKVLSHLKDRRASTLFLFMCGTAASQARRFHEASRILDRARTQSWGAPFEVEASVIQLEANIAAHRGRICDYIPLMKRCAETCPPDSPRRPHYMLNHLNALAFVGRLEEARDLYVSARKAARREEDRAHLDMALLENHIQTGRFEEASALLTTLKRFPTLQPELLTLELKLSIYMGSESGHLAEDLPGDSAKFWASHMRLLTFGQVREVLDSARAAAPLSEGIASHKDVEVLQVLLRAELALGDAATSEKILRHIQQFHGDHYMDSLFLARIRRLQGMESEARGLFHTLMREAASRKALGMVRFELSIAAELPPSDLFSWMSGEGGTPAPAPEVRHEGRPHLDAGRHREELRGVSRLIGKSSGMAKLRSEIKRFASHEATVLITGETGSGKEEVARALHEESPRHGEPFIPVNCSALTESLLESELFGHEKGAFTGADARRQGIFETAGKGTVFLDEIADMPPRLQASLLRVLENREIRPVGASRTLPISCRILAATNIPLETLVETGKFRADLLFRLRKLSVDIPPLRTRKTDILLLALHFLGDGKDKPPVIAADLGTLLKRWRWPGNVRELRNAMERLQILGSDKSSYDAADLDPQILGQWGLVLDSPPASEDSLEISTPSEFSATAGLDPIAFSGTPARRHERIVELARQWGRITPKELRLALKVAAPTIFKDVRELLSSGKLAKVPHSHAYTATS